MHDDCKTWPRGYEAVEDPSNGCERELRTIQLAIVGGGPAGLSAAIVAATLGVSSIILDESPRLGGQFFRQPPAGFEIVNEKKLGKEYRDGKRILGEIAEFGEKIEVWSESLVWGYFNDRELAVMHNGKSELLKADQIIIATGAFDRPIPFPGWTLPGVLTAGCAQIMVKNQRVLPGTRFLLAGSGPLQLALANQLLRSGAKIAAVVEATSMRRLWRYLPRLLKQPGSVWDGLRYIAKLKLNHVPYIQSHVIITASGTEEVDQAVIAAVDEAWQPIRGTEQTFDVDVICLGYGLIPNTDLTRLCGCAHEYNAKLGGWVPKYDEHMETTVRGIFVAGDGCGVAGVKVALEQGRISGIFAAHNLGLMDISTAEEMAQPIRAKSRELQDFQLALSELYSLRPGIHDLSTESTVICRCEEITLGDILKAIQCGASNLDDLKRGTRTGMGYCQGRMCLPSVISIASRELKLKPEEIGAVKARPPIKPVPMSAFLE